MQFKLAIPSPVLGQKMLKRVILTTMLAVSTFQTVRANDDALIEQSVNGTTAVIVRMDTGKIELSPQWTALAQQDASGAISQLLTMMTEPQTQVRELLNGETAFVAIDMPFGARIDARIHTSTNVPETNLLSAVNLFWQGTIGTANRASGWQTLQLTTASKVKSQGSSFNSVPADPVTWKTACAQAADYPIQLVFVLPKYVRDTFAELEPELPQILGGGPANPLVSGFRWMSLGIQPKDSTARIVIQTDSNATAELGRQQIPKMLQALMQGAKLDETTSTMMMAVVGLLNPTVEDSRIVIALDDPQKSSALLQLVATTVSAAAKPMAVSQTQNNLKQLALGMHNYYSAFRAFPTYAEIRKRETTSGLSWRVHILPYIDHAELYHAFKLDEPWDSDHNIKLLDRMPEVFKPVIPIGSKEKAKPFHTTYAAPIGEKTVFGRDKAIDFQNITDGTSNTIAFVELKPEFAIPWTSPEEYPFDPADPAAKLRVVNGAIAVALMDGSVHGFPADEPASFWNAFLSIDGGEVVKW